jgi:hypothetical protein
MPDFCCFRNFFLLFQYIIFKNTLHLFLPPFALIRYQFRPFANSPVRQFAPSPLRLFAYSPIRPFAPSPVRPFASSPLRPFAPSPVRPFASSPLRLFAPSPIRQPPVPLFSETIRYFFNDDEM